MKYKSNYNILEKQLLELNNNTFSDEYRYLRDLHFLLVDTEKEIYNRNYINATYRLRMCWDLSKNFIYYLIKHSNNNIMSDWHNNLKELKKPYIQQAKKYNYTYEDTVPSFRTMFREYPSNVKDSIDGVGYIKDIIKLFKNMNSWMHYRYNTNFKDSNTSININDDSTLYVHRSKVRYNKPSLKQCIEYLETISKVTFSIMNLSELYSISIDLDRFNPDIYKDGKYALLDFKSISFINNYINHKYRCPICEEGYFDLPDLEEIKESGWEYPFGPFLECSNPDCLAKVDRSLKVKRDMKIDKTLDSECPECHNNSLQQRVNLIINPKYIYKACNKCSYDYKSHYGDSEDEDLQDIFNQAEEIDWFFDDE